MIKLKDASASIVTALLLFSRPPLAGSSDLHFDVRDPAGRPVACRIHLTDTAGKPQQPSGYPFWKDHFVCDGAAVLSLPEGKYRHEIERGPEHDRLAGAIELRAGNDQTVRAELRGIADLARSGWYSGDLHVHRPPGDMELLMRAENLHIAPIITWWNKTNLWTGKDAPRELLRQFDGHRFYHLMAGEDERGGGALLYFHLHSPLAITDAAREYPAAQLFADEARRVDPAVWIDIEKPFWWDVPVWIAHGKCDSIEIANNHMCRSTMYPDEAWGRPRDRQRLPDPIGNGYWTQEIYYHLLNCGIRLPPSAGSASGVLPNPVGYNRVYVHVNGDLTYDKWWSGLKAGRTFVTNGPLLVCRANGELPGHVFQSADGKPVELTIDVDLTSLDRVRKLEIIVNGDVAQTVPLAMATMQTVKATLSLRESGWFLIRAIADTPQTFRFASTAPYYVELGSNRHRVSRRSARFFLEWVAERVERLRNDLKSENQLRQVVRDHERAREFWEDRLSHATAE